MDTKTIKRLLLFCRPYMKYLYLALFCSACQDRPAVWRYHRATSVNYSRPKDVGPEDRQFVALDKRQ